MGSANLTSAALTSHCSSSLPLICKHIGEKNKSPHFHQREKLKEKNGDRHFCDLKTGSTAGGGVIFWAEELSGNCIISGHTGLSGTSVQCAVFRNNPLWDGQRIRQSKKTETKVLFLRKERKKYRSIWKQTKPSFDFDCSLAFWTCSKRCALPHHRNPNTKAES